MYIECDGLVDTADMLTLEMIVAFATGLPEPPPLGFSPNLDCCFMMIMSYLMPILAQINYTYH